MSNWPRRSSGSASTKRVAIRAVSVRSSRSCARSVRKSSRRRSSGRRRKRSPSLPTDGSHLALRIGVLTGGGDAPGLNAAIRAVVLRATSLGHEVFGIADGWAGLLGEAAPRPLRPRDAARILAEGGTILGTSRTDPRKDERSRRAVLDSIRRWHLDGLVAIGGNDTPRAAPRLHEGGVRPVRGPKNRENHLFETHQP